MVVKRVCVEPPPSVIDVTLPAIAAGRWRACSTAPAAIDRYLLPQRAQQQTRRHRCWCRSMGQTDGHGRTPDRYIDPVPHTMRAA